MRIKSVIILANILVALLIAAAVALQAINDRGRVIDAAYQDAENLTNVLAEHTRQTLFSLDLAIGSVAETMAKGDGLSVEEVHQFLSSRQQLASGTFGFYTMDVGGRLVATSLRASPDPIDLSGYPEFRFHRDNPAGGLFIAAPRKGAVGDAAQKWIITFSRRIANPDGSFAGVVVAALSLDYLLDFYDVLRLGESGAVALFSPEGTLIARSPHNEAHMGRHYEDSGLMKDMAASHNSGLFSAVYPADGMRRISAYKVIEDSRALVIVGLGEQEILDRWRRGLMFDVVIGSLFFATFLIASLLVLGYFGQRRRWEEERSRRLKLIADESAALLKYRDVPSVLGHMTDTARVLSGAHQAVTSLTRDGSFAQDINAVSLSDKYAGWRDYDEASDGSGIYRLVCEHNRPMRLTQAELLAHPAWRGFGDASDRHPPMRGWLAVPIVAMDGKNLGLIQLSDKESGEFTEDDQNELVQLASITAASIENLQAIADREQALADANAARREVESIFTSISDAVYALDNDWCFVYLNAEAERLLNRRREDLLGKSVWDEFPETLDTVLHGEYQRARADRVPAIFEFFFPPLATWFSVRAFPHGGGLTVYFQDISLRIETEERLRQALKMDAIGQLTGGVAHDFNNLLTVILGASESLQDYLQQAPTGIRSQADAIHKAGERAAALTHRLLAFARKQPLDPRLTSINTLLGDVEDMLRRTLGENVNIELVRGSGLWKAIVDPHELQNAILNLAINARDAMPEGGKLTIETANMAVDANYADVHGITPGQYVMVAVSDTGAGMSPETVTRAFEPFFTTKDVGKGSGLGLSMVYGFARQSGGHAKIYSEAGEGTTVKIYLPRGDTDSEAAYSANRLNTILQGSESVLLVEDDELVREHTVNCLHSLGYRVDACEDGHDALSLLDSGAHYDLLLTDVVLPGGMSGRVVAEKVTQREPSIKVLYMSGYTENAIVHHGRLDRGVHLLGKPFRLADLGRKVREVLDGS